jgi:hypothetical protein
MENSTWLWLHEAANLVASRLAETAPDKASNPKTALNEARRQLLDQAYRGSLEVQGKPGDPETEPPLSLRDWVVVNSSFWDPNHRPATGAISDISLTVIWENNCFTYEDEGIYWGYDNLRVQKTDIDRHWPCQTVAAVNEATRRMSSNATNAPQRNPGGAPRKYRDDLLIEIIRIADIAGLPDRRSDLFQQLRNLSLPLPHWDRGAALGIVRSTN